LLSTRSGKSIDGDEWLNGWKDDTKLIKRHGFTFDEEETWMKWKTEPVNDTGSEDRSITREWLSYLSTDQLHQGFQTHGRGKRLNHESHDMLVIIKYHQSFHSTPSYFSGGYTTIRSISAPLNV
jgi:hypothetical protein